MILSYSQYLKLFKKRRLTVGSKLYQISPWMLNLVLIINVEKIVTVELQGKSHIAHLKE